MTLVTDMNQRERERYIKSLEGVREHTDKLIAALRAGDDTESFTAAVLYALTSGGEWLKELLDIFTTAASVKVPDTAEGAEVKPAGGDET